jgi:ribosomal protein L19
MINIINESTFYPKFQIGDTIKINFKSQDLKNLKSESICGQVIKIHKNQENFFITIYANSLGVTFKYSFLLSLKYINNIVVIKHQSYRKSKLYFLKKIKNF